MSRAPTGCRNLQAAAQSARMKALGLALGGPLVDPTPSGLLPFEENPMHSALTSYVLGLQHEERTKAHWGTAVTNLMITALSSHPAHLPGA